MSTIDILEDLTFESFPAFFPRISLLWILAREAGDPQSTPGRARIFLNDTQLFEAPAEIEFQGQLRTRVIIVLGGLAVTGPGKLKFEWATQDSAVVATYIVDIISAPRVLAEGEQRREGVGVVF